MALVINNTLGDVTGKIGVVVYRRMNGKTFVSERPSHYKPAKTAAARKVRSSFGMGVQLSKKLILDPALKNAWAAAKIEGTDSYHRIIKHNSKFIIGGAITDRCKITPDGLFLGVNSVSLQNDVLHLSLNCPVENDLVFPAKLNILYYFPKAGQSLILTGTSIASGSADGIYEQDIKPGKSILKLLNENDDALLFVALISETARKKKAYWTSTAAAHLV